MARRKGCVLCNARAYIDVVSTVVQWNPRIILVWERSEDPTGQNSAFDISNTTRVMEKQTKLYSDVVIIGAGLSGINMACQLQRQLQVTSFVIYDRAAELGGAWAANKCNVILSLPGFNLWLL